MTKKYLYVFAGDGDLVKVGLSNNPARRAEDLSSKGRVLRVAYSQLVPDGISPRRSEISAHARLWSKREHGEWFNVSADEASQAVTEAIDFAIKGEFKKLPPRPGARTRNISVRLKPDTKRRLMELAAADERSLSQYLSMILTVHLDEIAKKRNAEPTP